MIHVGPGHADGFDTGRIVKKVLADCSAQLKGAAHGGGDAQCRNCRTGIVSRRHEIRRRHNARDYQGTASLMHAALQNYLILTTGAFHLVLRLDQG